MVELLIKYGKYAPIVIAVLLIWSAFSPSKSDAKWYVRGTFGVMGLVLLYTMIHMMVRAKN
jgi:hypothetical protein